MLTVISACANELRWILRMRMFPQFWRVKMCAPDVCIYNARTLRRSSIMAAELFIARLPSLSNVEVFEAELKTLQSPFLQHLKSRCRCYTQ